MLHFRVDSYPYLQTLDYEGKTSHGQSWLLQKSVNYGRKKFYSIGPGSEVTDSDGRSSLFAAVKSFVTLGLGRKWLTVTNALAYLRL